MRNKEDELKRFLRERDELFRNPTLEAAQQYWKKSGNPKPSQDDVPLAMVHKARLQWLDATNEMLSESRTWLVDHGYFPSTFDAPPLTPYQRDADRVIIGKKPLGEE
jgi:hypothetical protein